MSDSFHSSLADIYCVLFLARHGGIMGGTQVITEIVEELNEYRRRNDILIFVYPLVILGL